MLRAQHMHSITHRKRNLLSKTTASKLFWTRGIKDRFPVSLPLEAMGLQDNPEGPHRQENAGRCYPHKSISEQLNCQKLILKAHFRDILQVKRLDFPATEEPVLLKLHHLDISKARAYSDEDQKAKRARVQLSTEPSQDYCTLILAYHSHIPLSLTEMFQTRCYEPAWPSTFPSGIRAKAKQPPFIAKRMR